MDALMTARRLAADHPERPVPCPICAASLHGENLERHLAKVHIEDRPAGPELIGVDHAAVTYFIVLQPLAFLALFAIGLFTNGPSQTVLGVFIGVFALGAIGLVLAGFGKLKARLTLGRETLRLRYLLGLRTLTVRLPAPIEVGRMRAFLSRPGSHDTNTPSFEVSGGTYLRIGRLTVGAPKSDGLRKHWQLAPGKPTKRWHVVLDRRSLVALEYHLYALGLIEPRPSQSR